MSTENLANVEENSTKDSDFESENKNWKSLPQVFTWGDNNWQQILTNIKNGNQQLTWSSSHLATMVHATMNLHFLTLLYLSLLKYNRLSFPETVLETNLQVFIICEFLQLD